MLDVDKVLLDKLGIAFPCLFGVFKTSTSSVCEVLRSARVNHIATGSAKA